MALGQNAKAIWQHIIAKGTFGSVLQKVNILTAENGKCTAELKVTEDVANSRGNLHGGMSATIVDVVSTLALSTSKRAAIGVSVDIHMTYLKGASIGEEVVISANTLRAGITLAFLDVIISKKSNGELVATGTHTKFIGNCRWSLSGHCAAVTCLKLDPCGGACLFFDAECRDRSIRVWNLLTGEQSAVYSPDSAITASEIRAGGSVVVLAMEGSNLLAMLRLYSSTFENTAIDPPPVYGLPENTGLTFNLDER